MTELTQLRRALTKLQGKDTSLMTTEQRHAHDLRINALLHQLARLRGLAARYVSRS